MRTAAYVLVLLAVLVLATPVLSRTVGTSAGAGAKKHHKRAHANAHHHKVSATETVPAPKKSGVVQYSKEANAYFFTPNAITYTGHEDTVVAAWGVFADTLHSTGWGELTVTSSGKVPDFVQAYAAGYAEGALTAQRIYELFVVIHDVHAKKPEVGEFIRAQDRFIRSKIRAFDVLYRQRQREDKQRQAFILSEVDSHSVDSDAGATNDADANNAARPFRAASKPARANARVSSSASRLLNRIRTSVTAARSSAKAAVGWSEFEMVYWFNVKLIMAQFDGLLAGYNKHRNPATTKALTNEDLWLVNDDGDILDIERAVSPGRVFSNPSQPARQELIELLSYNTRCSVMVKWVPGEDLICGHATWDDYNEMNRMYKFYQFKFSDPLHAGALHSQRTHMSSYPGMIFSSDDFYILDSGLVLLETTLNILNEKLYQHSDPQSTVMAWIRNIVANRLASSGKEWTSLFGHYNSGTYNNQWMVVDYKLFNKANAASLAPDTIWLVEQIPGFTKSADVTSILQEKKYWASYNRPFFQETNELSMFEHFATVGPAGATQREREIFSYSQCPRAKIFAREADDVDDVEDMKTLLRLNQYVTDEVSDGCPGNAIAARFDLKATNKKCDVTTLKANGATDAKVTNADMASRMEAEAVAGPTDDDQMPFDWSTTNFKKPAGQPDVFDFDWKLMKADTQRV